MSFAQPLWLILLLILPLLMYQYRQEAGRRHVTLQVSRLTAMKGLKTWVVYARNWIQYLRWVTLALCIIAIARPQLLWHEESVEAEAIDIMLVMDLSPSMLSKDFSPDRLTVAKEMANTIVNRRPYDRIGLVVFSGGAFTQCPLTNDRRLLLAFINNLQVGRLPDGSAIGMCLGVALQRLDKSESKSKIIILITDGENNEWDLEPLQAGAFAKALGVKIFSLGIGSEGLVLSPAYQKGNGTYAFENREMNFNSLLFEKLSSMSGGQFFRIKTGQETAEMYKTIEKLDKDKVKVLRIKHHTELYFWFLNAAFCLMVLELLLRWGPLRVITV